MTYPSGIAWTDKQLRFIEEYVVDSNATQAAIRAGYAPRTASRAGSRLVRNVEVRAEIDKRLTRIAADVDITVQKVLRDIEDTRVSAASQRDHGAALRASELQGKFLKMFTDKVQQETDMHITVVTGVPERDV